MIIRLEEDVMMIRNSKRCLNLQENWLELTQVARKVLLWQLGLDAFHLQILSGDHHVKVLTTYLF